MCAMEPEDTPAFVRLPDGTIVIVRPDGTIERIDLDGSTSPINEPNKPDSGPLH